MNKNQIELKKEVENKLDRAAEIYGRREYAVSFPSVKNFVSRVERIGYKATKTKGVENHYVISQK